jgi:hypothetical protein
MPTVRKHERHLTLKTARITSDFMADILPCAILDLSAGGACLLVADAAPLPNEFDLTIDHTGDRWHCKVAWKLRHRVGISFVSDHIPVPA